MRSFSPCFAGNFKGLCKQIDHFPEDADYEADTAEYFLRECTHCFYLPPGGGPCPSILHRVKDQAYLEALITAEGRQKLSLSPFRSADLHTCCSLCLQCPSLPIFVWQTPTQSTSAKTSPSPGSPSCLLHEFPEDGTLSLLWGP